MTTPMLIGETARVLVVDDDRTMRMLLRHALERDGYEVSEADNGVQGLARFKDEAPDIVLMDAAMPEMDGFALCAALQKLPHGGETPVLMITGLNDDVSVEQAFSAGASDFITKPVNWAVLRQRVRRMVDQRRAERHINYLAYHDSLTGLPNRTLFIERLEQSLARARRTSGRLSVMFLDLDGFKLVNDTLGHDVGDVLLKIVSDRLITCLRESDTVARLGGDEFTTILHDVTGNAEINVAAHRLLDALSRPIELADREVFVGASIGAAVYPGDGADVRTLLRSADMAMYRAKEAGRNNFQFYNPEMGDRAVLRMSMENGARRALENDEYTAYYQPIVDLQDGSVVSFEALIRWEHPGLGLIAPADFIPLAEETGLIDRLGRWILTRACTDAAEWHSRGLAPTRVSVNLSAKQLNDPALVGAVASILEDTGHPADRLVLEITENAVMQNTDHAIEMLEELKGLGVGLCIDDFGRGYSSLSQLKRLPIDTIKIDGSFVNGLPGDTDNSAIVTAIVAMGHGLRMKVVAEGVETDEQCRFLRELGCEYVQGHLTGRPAPVEEIEERLAGGGSPLSLDRRVVALHQGGGS